MLTEEGTVQIEKTTPLQETRIAWVPGIEKATAVRVSKNRARHRIRYQKYAKDETQKDYLGRS